MNRPRTKNEFMNKRVHWWVCLSCNEHYRKKVKVCRCQSTDIQYFASSKELQRFRELLMLLQCGDISNLELQTSYPIVLNGVKVFTYCADFKYKRKGQWIIEDVKGNKDYLTDVFRLKKKTVEAVYGIKLTIVT